MAVVSSDHPHHQPLTLLTRSRSGSGPLPHAMGSPHSPHGHSGGHHHAHSFIDELAGAAGHGLLQGKTRTTQLYPSMSASEEVLRNSKNKKGI